MDESPPPCFSGCCCRIEFYRLYGIRDWHLKFAADAPVATLTPLASVALIACDDQTASAASMSGAGAGESETGGA